MKESIETYVASLDAFLAKRLPPQKRKPILDEVRSHLLLATKEGMAHGETEEASAARALREFGDVNEVAENLIRQHTGVNTTSAWRLAKVPIWLYSTSVAVVIISLVLQWLYPNFFMLRLQQPVYLIVEACLLGALLMFGIAVAKSRRWLVVPLATVVLIGCVATLLVRSWEVASGSKMFPGSIEQARLLAGGKSLIMQDEEDLAYAKNAYEAAKLNEVLDPKTGDRFIPHVTQGISSVMILWGIPIRTSYVTDYRLAPTPLGTDPRVTWLKDGPAMITRLQSEISEAKDLPKHFKRQGVLQLAWQSVQGQWSISVISMVLMLTVINWVLLLLGTASDQLKRRRARVA